MADTKDIRSLVWKMDWEGGIGGLVEHFDDIDDYVVSQDLKDAFNDLVKAYDRFEGLLEAERKAGNVP